MRLTVTRLDKDESKGQSRRWTVPFNPVKSNLCLWCFKTQSVCRWCNHTVWHLDCRLLQLIWLLLQASRCSLCCRWSWCAAEFVVKKRLNRLFFSHFPSHQKIIFWFGPSCPITFVKILHWDHQANSRQTTGSIMNLPSKGFCTDSPWRKQSVHVSSHVSNQPWPIRSQSRYPNLTPESQLATSSSRRCGSAKTQRALGDANNEYVWKRRRGQREGKVRAAW